MTCSWVALLSVMNKLMVTIAFLLRAWLTMRVLAMEPLLIVLTSFDLVRRSVVVNKLLDGWLVGWLVGCQ